MKTTLTLLLGMLFSIRSRSAQIVINKPSDFSDGALKKVLLRIKQSEISDKYSAQVLETVRAALLELKGGALTRGTSHNLSVILVERYGWMKIRESQGEPLSLLLRNAIIIVNHRMTAKIHDEYAYPEDIDGYLKGSLI